MTSEQASGDMITPEQIAFVETLGRPGAFGGSWRADPADRSVLVFLAHDALDFDTTARGMCPGVYSPITRIHAADPLGATGAGAPPSPSTSPETRSS